MDLLVLDHSSLFFSLYSFYPFLSVLCFFIVRESIVRSYDMALPPVLVDKLIEESYYIDQYARSLPSLQNAKYRTFWMPYEDFISCKAGPDEFEFDPTKSAVEQAVAYLRNFAMPNKNTIGAEWWFQVIDPDQKGKIIWHVDKDESIASNQWYVVNVSCR